MNSGVWRKTSMESYQTENPEWTTVLDVDALAEKDGISWVWKGSTALPRGRDPMSDSGRIVTRTLLSLSRGGSDATHIKEWVEFGAKTIKLRDTTNVKL